MKQLFQKQVEILMYILECHLTENMQSKAASFGLGNKLFFLFFIYNSFSFYFFIYMFRKLDLDWEKILSAHVSRPDKREIL